MRGWAEVQGTGAVIGSTKATGRQKKNLGQKRTSLTKVVRQLQERAQKKGWFLMSIVQQGLQGLQGLRLRRCKLEMPLSRVGSIVNNKIKKGVATEACGVYVSLEWSGKKKKCNCGMGKGQRAIRGDAIEEMDGWNDGYMTMRRRMRKKRKKKVALFKDFCLFGYG